MLAARNGVQVGGNESWWLGRGGWWVETHAGGLRCMLVARYRVEMGGLGPKTGLGGSERVSVGQEAVLVVLNVALGVERGCR